MLNCGQVVLDTDNNRVLIFAGTSVYSNEGSDDPPACWSKSAFITKDGKFIKFDSRKEDKDNPKRFKYTNFRLEGTSDWRKTPIGSFVPALGLGGVYFGTINEKLLEQEHLDAAREAIEEFEQRGWVMSEPDDGHIYPLLGPPLVKEVDGSKNLYCASNIGDDTK